MFFFVFFNIYSIFTFFFNYYTCPYDRISHDILHRNIHLTLTLTILCMIRLKGDDEILINNRHRTFPATNGSTAIIDLFLSSLFNLFMHKPFKVNVR